MNFVRPAGKLPARPIILDRQVARSAAFAAAGVLAALNAQAAQILSTLHYNSTLDSIANLAGISAVVWIALFAVIRIGLEDGDPMPSRLDWSVLAAVVALSFLPVSLSAKLGLLLCAVYLTATSSPGSHSRRVALILLALTGPLIWGRLLLQLFAGPILSLDAHLVALVTGSEAAGNMVRFAGQNGRILIGNACSSVHNVSLALVLWTTGAVMFRVRVDRGYLGIGALMAAWMFLLNIARLTLIDLRPADYLFLHNGAGAAFFGWTGLIGIAGLSGLGILRAADRQR